MVMRNWGRAAVLAVAVLAGLTAVPAVAESTEITDPADDAYRYPGPFAYYEPKPPLAPLSNDAADLLTVKFANAVPTHPGHDGAYSVSVTVDGEPHATYNYLVGAEFGDDCYLIHFLRAGETRKALASCGSGEEFRTVASLTGTAVSVTGSTISATFSYRRFALPRELKSEPIKNLYALTCPVTSDSWGCNDDVIDFVFTDATFRI